MPDDPAALWEALCQPDTPQELDDRRLILMALSSFQMLHPKAQGMSLKAISEATKIGYFDCGSQLNLCIYYGYVKKKVIQFKFDNEEGESVYYSITQKGKASLNGG